MTPALSEAQLFWYVVALDAVPSTVRVASKGKRLKTVADSCASTEPAKSVRYVEERILNYKEG